MRTDENLELLFCVKNRGYDRKINTHFGRWDSEIRVYVEIKREECIDIKRKSQIFVNYSIFVLE